MTIKILHFMLQVILVLGMCLLLLEDLSSPVKAQSANDGFNPGADGDVNVMLVQPDGAILVGGVFDTLDGGTRHRTGYLSTDGKLDTSFDSGADGVVYALTQQKDGRVLVGGAITTLNGVPRNILGHLTENGGLDMEDAGLARRIKERMMKEVVHLINLLWNLFRLYGEQYRNLARTSLVLAT